METSDTAGTEVPCGRCYNCLMTKRSVWTFRILMELREAESAYFITLTYDSKNVPIVTRYNQVYLSLRLKDIQRFFKRLRKDITEEFHPCKRVGPVDGGERWLKRGKDKKVKLKDGCRYEQRWSPKFRYFAVGEYGTKWSKRPHYHIVAYNIPNSYFKEDPFGKIWSDKLEKIWKKGIVDIGKVEHGSAHYMTKYHMHPQGEWKYSEDDPREAPFAVMSRKPGIGANYVTDKIIDHFRDSKNFCATLKNGIRQPLGRYYKEKILGEIEGYGDTATKARIEAREKEEKYRDSFKTEVDYFRNKRDRYNNARKKGERMLKKNNKI